MQAIIILGAGLQLLMSKPHPPLFVQANPLDPVSLHDHHRCCRIFIIAVQNLVNCVLWKYLTGQRWKKQLAQDLSLRSSSYWLFMQYPHKSCFINICKRQQINKSSNHLASYLSSSSPQKHFCSWPTPLTDPGC